MREFINIIERVERASFRLHPGLNPDDFHLTSSLGDVNTKWKARIFDANSAAEDQKIGQMDDVGYVMISLADDTIVPIARADEHHRGEDTMWAHVQRRKIKGLNPSDYVPLFWSSNYLYHREEIAPLLIACRKYLAYGGHDTVIQGSNDYNNMAMRMSQFVERNGDVVIAPKTIAPLGQQFLELLDQLREDCAAARGAMAMRSATAKAGRSASKIVDFFESIIFTWIGLGEWPTGGARAVFATWRKQIREFVAADDIQALEEMWFGFGIKNAMHQKLRKTMAEIAKAKGHYISDERYMRAFWGDLDLANDILGRY